MYKYDKDELAIKDLQAFVEDHKQKVSRYKRLQNYYEGRPEVVARLPFERGGNPPERNLGIFSPYAKYITDMLTGYFLGTPVRYSAVDRDTEDDDKLLEILNGIFKYNDEQEANAGTGKTCSIKGRAVEILWADADANVRFKTLQPEEAFAIYDNTLEENIRFGVRMYTSASGEDYEEFVEVTDHRTTKTYRVGDPWLLVDEAEHYFDDVPFVYYANNAEEMGDWESVITLIDAYNKTQTNTLQDMDDFTDSYLCLVNMAGTTKEDLRRAKESRTLLLESDGDAKWLTKAVNDAWVENIKNRLNHDIHKFTATPDLNDEQFGANLSGVSLRYKLLGMEQVRAMKERKFKKGRQRRMELSCKYLRYSKNEAYDYTGIGIDFNNSLPQNVVEIAQTIQSLSPYLSRETLISMLPMVENAQEEMEKKKAEDEADMPDYAELAELMRAREPDGDEDEE